MPEEVTLFSSLQNRQQVPAGGGAQRRARRIFTHAHEDIISVENLLGAWKEFLKDKRKKQDVLEFQYNLMDNVLELHRELVSKTYRHGPYHAFTIADPKPRNIHKASVRDRLLHHALYRKLCPLFDKTFIDDSYSCRVGKGTHKAMNRFRQFAYRVSQNHTRTCFVLKCDIRKFFASIDHSILLSILRRYISDKEILGLLSRIIESFQTRTPKTRTSDVLVLGKGLPLGNLTSQLLVNVYLNEFDQFVKHRLKAKHYLRYADDFVILSHNKQRLQETLPYMEVFLRDCLKLELHLEKVFIKTLASGLDFLGWVHFPDHRVPRTVTKRRMFRRIEEQKRNEQTIQLYLGLLSHGNTYTLRKKL